MATPMARQKHDRLAAERAEAELVRGPAKRAFDSPPFDIGEAVDAIKPAAANDADNPAGHRAVPLSMFDEFMLGPSRLPRRPCGPPRNDNSSLSLRAKRSNLVETNS